MKPILDNPKLLAGTLATPSKLGSVFDDSEMVNPSEIDSGSPVKPPTYKTFKDMYNDYNDVDWVEDYKYTRPQMHNYNIATSTYVPDLPDLPSNGRRNNLSGRKYEENPARRALWNLVGSEQGQRIYQDNDFMSPNSLKIFNKKRAARGQKPFVGKFERHVADSDNIPEFVVYDNHGNIAAVNGYTTGRSDWGIRSKYYNEYPTRASRKGMPYRQFIDDYYNEHATEYGLEYDTAGFLTDDGKTRAKQLMKDSPYSMRLRIPSPYSLFGQIVKHVIEQTIEEWGQKNEFSAKDIKLILNEAYGYESEDGNKRGWELPFKSQLWRALIINPFLAGCAKKADYRIYQDTWKRNHNIPESVTLDAEDLEKFHKAYLSKSAIKDRLKAYITPKLTPNNPARAKLAEAIQTAIDQLLVGMEVNTDKGKVRLQIPDSGSSRSLSLSQ